MPILILLVHHIRSIDLLRNLSEDVFRAIVPQKVTSAEDSDGELPGQVAAELENFDEVDREPRAQIVRLLANELLELEVYAKKPQQKKKMWQVLGNTFTKKYIGTQNPLRKQLDRLKLVNSTGSQCEPKCAGIRRPHPCSILYQIRMIRW